MGKGKSTTQEEVKNKQGDKEKPETYAEVAKHGLTLQGNDA